VLNDPVIRPRQHTVRVAQAVPQRLSIGLTYNLRSAVPEALVRKYGDDYFAELDSEVTIDALAWAIGNAGHEVLRIGGVEQLVELLAAGTRLDGVFNFAEGLWGNARESQIPALLDAYHVPYTFSDPLTLAVCIDKALSKRVWQGQGLPTPHFWLAMHDADVDAILRDAPVYPLFVKPVREGSSKGIDAGAIVTSGRTLRERVRLVAERYDQHALVEAFASGREYTVGVLGSGAQATVLGVAEVTAAANGGVYGYGEKHPDDEGNGLYARVPAGDRYDQLARLGLKAYQALGVQDAGRLDIRLDAAGQPQLLEINPLAGLHPQHSAMPAMARWAGLSFDDLIACILEHATRRWAVGGKRPGSCHPERSEG
jgi:D-alanine-D-alanine ligase